MKKFLFFLLILVFSFSVACSLATKEEPVPRPMPTIDVVEMRLGWYDYYLKIEWSYQDDEGVVKKNILYRYHGNDTFSRDLGTARSYEDFGIYPENINVWSRYDYGVCSVNTENKKSERATFTVFVMVDEDGGYHWYKE